MTAVVLSPSTRGMHHVPVAPHASSRAPQTQNFPIESGRLIIGHLREHEIVRVPERALRSVVRQPVETGTLSEVASNIVTLMRNALARPGPEWPQNSRKQVKRVYVS